MTSALALSSRPIPTSPAPAQWLPRDRFLAYAKRSDAWLRSKINSGAILCRQTTRRLCNGRLEIEIPVAALPPDALERYEAEQHRLAPAQPRTLDLFAQPHLIIEHPRRVALKPHQRSEADARMDILQSVLAYRNHVRNGDAGTGLQLADGRAVNSLDRMVAYTAEQSTAAGMPVSSRAIYRWLARYDSGGVAELARQRRADADQSRWFSKHPEAACLVASLYLGDGFFPGLSVSACYRMLLAQRDLVGVAPGDLPSRTTVGHFLASTPAHLKVMAQKGRKTYQENVLPHLRRDYTEAANAIWVSDHMVADVEVQNDCFLDKPFGTPIRLRLTAILDHRSRFLVGYSWCWEGTSASIATAVRRAVLAHGPADHILVDNGKDFLKTAKGATPGYLARSPLESDGWVDAELDRLDRQIGIFARLGMRVTHSIPHHPQGKHIERFFGTVHEQFCRLFWTYTTGSPATRPDATTALMQIQRKANRAGEPDKGLHPAATMFMAAFQSWVDQYHAEGNRNMQGTGGRSPAQVFEEERNPAQRPAPPPEELACLLAEHTTAKVDSCAVRVNRSRYVPETDEAAALMQRFHGERVTVAYDPLDPSVVAILDQHMHLITILPQERLMRFAPEDPETQQRIADSMAQRGFLRKTTSSQLQTITRERKRLGIRHPLELLAENAASGNAAPFNANDIVTQRTPKLRNLAPKPVQQVYTADAVNAFFAIKAAEKAKP